MNVVRSTLIFYVVGWIVGYNLLGIPVYLFMIGMEACMEEWVNAEFWPGLIMNALAGVIMGLLLGSLDLAIEYLVKRKISFLSWFLIRSSIYTLAFVGLGLMTQVTLRTLATGDLQESVELTTAGSGINILTGYLIFSLGYSLLLSFVNQLRRMLRRGIMIPLFLGRYFKPRTEERIFLFLDLKSSTTLTEQLGHLRYSSLIQDCFYDLDQLVSRYSADIYQYVGDEVVLTWHLEKGIRDNKCLELFFAFEKKLKSRQHYYETRYQTQPQFKGGMSGGMVTTTEIGSSRREITHYGDVLNVAARLQSLCNSLGESLLVSHDLWQRLHPRSDVEARHIGPTELKGKEEPVAIVAVGRQQAGGKVG